MGLPSRLHAEYTPSEMRSELTGYFTLKDVSNEVR